MSFEDGSLIRWCAKCHKVEDAGGWYAPTVEPDKDGTTHTVCPRCVALLYPSMAADIEAARRSEIPVSRTARDGAETMALAVVFAAFVVVLAWLLSEWAIR